MLGVKYVHACLMIIAIIVSWDKTREFSNLCNSVCLCMVGKKHEMYLPNLILLEDKN